MQPPLWAPSPRGSPQGPQPCSDLSTRVRLPSLLCGVIDPRPRAPGSPSWSAPDSHPARKPQGHVFWGGRTWGALGLLGTRALGSFPAIHTHRPSWWRVGARGCRGSRCWIPAVGRSMGPPTFLWGGPWGQPRRNSRPFLSGLAILFPSFPRPSCTRPWPHLCWDVLVSQPVDGVQVRTCGLRWGVGGPRLGLSLRSPSGLLSGTPVGPLPNMAIAPAPQTLPLDLSAKPTMCPVTPDPGRG